MFQKHCRKFCPFQETGSVYCILTHKMGSVKHWHIMLRNPPSFHFSLRVRIRLNPPPQQHSSSKKHSPSCKKHGSPDRSRSEIPKCQKKTDIAPFLLESYQIGVCQSSRFWNDFLFTMWILPTSVVRVGT